MAYTPTNWINGQPPALNAENLNKIERGLVAANVDTTQISHTETAGYFNSNGTIAGAGSGTKEVYTEKIEVNPGDTLIFNWRFNEAHLFWYGYMLYDSQGERIGYRHDIPSLTNVNSYMFEYVADEAKYIAISYRTYGESNVLTLQKVQKVEYVQEQVQEAKSNINKIMTAQYSTVPGYIGVNGELVGASSTTQEKCTNALNVSGSSKLEYALAYPTQRAIWIGIGEYKKDGTFIRRDVPVNDVLLETSGSVTLDAECAYIKVSWRSYGDSDINLSIITSVYTMANEWEQRKQELDGITLTQTFTNPLRLNKCYDHLFVDRTGANITIPHESIYHARLSKKLGFDVIEANIMKTSDGVYVVNHGNGGKFGQYFHHIDGTTDISGTAFSSVTWQWIVNNVRYNSQFAKYQTRPCRLEEFLQECNQQGIIPFLQIVDNGVISLADKYLGKNNYIAYGGTRAQLPNGIIYHWVTRTSKADILAYCESIGRPFIYGMANPTAFTDAQLRDIIDTLHENGYLIGSSYVDTNWDKYAGMGFDVNGTQTRLNQITNGNLCNFETTTGFSDFTVVNAVEQDGKLVFNSWGSVTPKIGADTYSVAGFYLEISFTGTITVENCGEHTAKAYTSDGSFNRIISAPVINGAPRPVITGINGTVINDIKFKASRF